MRTDHQELEYISHVIAAAVAGRDVSTLRCLLAPGFVYRSFAGESSDAETFLSGVSQIPGEILFVRVGDLQIEVDEDRALVTGVQQAQVNVEGQVVDDRRGFVDYFIRSGGAWLLRVAVDVGSLP